MPPLADIGMGGDDTDFDPDWWPSVLTEAAKTPRPRAWRTALRQIGPATGAAFVGVLVFSLVIGLAMAQRPAPKDTRQFAAQSELGADGPVAGTWSLAGTPSPQAATPVASPAQVAAAMPTMPAPRVVYAGPPPARAAVRLDEPILYWLPEIEAAAASTGVPAALIAGVMRVESQGEPAARSPAGARGLMQVMPVHLREQGIDPGMWHDPATNIQAGAKLLKWKIESAGGESRGVASYFGYGCDGFNCTNEYVDQVFSWHDHYAPLIANPYQAGFRVLPAR